MSEVLAGRYRLVELIGRGGAGEVWRAEDAVLDRQVAVKLLRALEGDPLDSMSRFQAEARAAARLMHPNVVATYDVGAAGDQVFLVQELVTGKDLTALLRSAGLPGGKLVADLAIQGARGLEAAHRAGIVHRDIKPANLLLAADGTVKITDFGIAKTVGAETTGLGVLLGTAAYVSPEQVRGEPAIPASDWYAFGCVLYELVTGTPPFAGPTVDEVMRRHLETPPDPTPLHTRTDVPPGLTTLILQLLAKNPAHRPTSASAVQSTLENPLAERTTQVLPLLTPDLPATSGDRAAGAPSEPPSSNHPATPLAAALVGENLSSGDHPAALPAAAPAGEQSPSGGRPGAAPAAERSAGRVLRGPVGKVLVGIGVAVAAVLGVVFLRAGLVEEPPARAGGTPSVTPSARPMQTAAVKPTATAKPTVTAQPTRKPTQAATPKPKQKATEKPARTGIAGALTTLAGLVRNSGDGRGERAAKEAARDLDRAAEKFADGKRDEAAKHFHEARRRLVTAQRQDRWHSTPQITAYFAVLGPALPAPDGWNRGNDDDHDEDDD